VTLQSEQSIDDLEECWRILLPDQYRYTVRDFERIHPPPYVSVLATDRLPRDRLRNLFQATDWPSVPVSEVLWNFINHGRGMHTWIEVLLEQTQRGFRAKCEALSKIAPLARFLCHVHGIHLDAHEKRVVSRALVQWALGEWRTWDKEACDLLGDPEEIASFVHLPLFEQTQLLHFLLLAGVYEVFDRGALSFAEIDILTRTPLLTTAKRRERACELDTLLEELDKWDRHEWSGHITVILRWSGSIEDATLLRHLCPPLMSKIDGSKLRVP